MFENFGISKLMDSTAKPIRLSSKYKNTALLTVSISQIVEIEYFYRFEYISDAK